MDDNVIIIIVVALVLDLKMCVKGNRICAGGASSMILVLLVHLVENVSPVRLLIAGNNVCNMRSMRFDTAAQRLSHYYTQNNTQQRVVSTSFLVIVRRE